MKLFSINIRAISHLTRTIEVRAETEQQARDEIAARFHLGWPPILWDRGDAEDEQIESIEEMK